MEFRVVWPDSSVHWLRSVGREERTIGSVLKRSSGAVIDVTERRNAENALGQLNLRLAAQVEEEVTRREAVQARAGQAERMQVLGQLAGGIAHDINNVLQSVQSAAALIERRPDKSDHVVRFARLILECSERGASVTGRLLTFARQSDLRAERLDGSELLQGVGAILSSSLGSSFSVRIHADDGLPHLQADKSQLEIALLNLATNARDAMSGGGTIVLSASSEVVIAGVDHPAPLVPGRYISLSVTDTGTGMEAKTLKRAFEPFFTTKPVGQGTGLGLSMAKGFAEQSGGGLHVISEPGEGTTVVIWLPEAPGSLASPTLKVEAASVSAAAEMSCARVLLVDDDNIVRETIGLLLEEGGYKVVQAGSGTEALALLNDGEHIDLMLTDFSMPGMDGLALIRAVHGQRPGLATILLTGHIDDAAQLAVSGAVSGTFSLVRKPVRARQLLGRVSDLLDCVRVRAAG